MLPANCRGDGTEFVLLSGNVEERGMVDGRLRRVVMFPDDGHPISRAMCSNIYTQDRPFAGNRIYAPVRNPDYNE